MKELGDPSDCGRLAQVFCPMRHCQRPIARALQKPSTVSSICTDSRPNSALNRQFLNSKLENLKVWQRIDLPVNSSTAQIHLFRSKHLSEPLWTLFTLEDLSPPKVTLVSLQLEKKA